MAQRASPPYSPVDTREQTYPLCPYACYFQLPRSSPRRRLPPPAYLGLSFRLLMLQIVLAFIVAMFIVVTLVSALF